MRGRKRDTATFTVSEYWKGSPAKTAVVHLVEPRSDCIGADFNLGQEYLVFAVAQRAKDYRLGNDYFWYGWLDILHEGDRILTVNRVCDSTAEIKDASAALRELGKGKRTH